MTTNPSFSLNRTSMSSISNLLSVQLLSHGQMRCVKEIAFGNVALDLIGCELVSSLNQSEDTVLTAPRTPYVPLHLQNAIHTFLDRVRGFESEVRDCSVCMERYYVMKVVEPICARCAGEVSPPINCREISVKGCIDLEMSRTLNSNKATRAIVQAGWTLPRPQGTLV